MHLTLSPFLYFFVNYGRLDALKRPYVGLSRIYVIGHKTSILTTHFQIHVIFCRGASGVNISPLLF